MDISNKYCFYTGTDNGTIEYSYCVPNEKIPFCCPLKPSKITAFEWGPSGDEIIIGYEAGYVHIYNTTTNKYCTKINKDLEGEGAVVGVAAVQDSVIIARHDCCVNVYRKNKETKKKRCQDFYVNQQEKATLNCVLLNAARGNVIGTGGEHNDFQLWNFETQQCLFKAKSLGHDELNLPIPTSVRGITFFPSDSYLSACATKEGHVLLYDDRAQRRPVSKFLRADASFTCIATAFRERQCLVGTTKGYMMMLDLKMPGKCLKTFKSYTGSVTSIVCDPNEPLVASTSLDRYLRIHNLETKELVQKVYMKQRLTKLLMKVMDPVVKEEVVEEGENVADEEYEELFNNMETIDDGKKSMRKRKPQSNTVDDKNRKLIRAS